MTAEQYFVEQAKFNKWLFELTPEEAKHILWMLNDYAEAKAKEAFEAAREVYDNEYPAINMPLEKIQRLRNL